ncbi:3-hydroxyacyl-CoA dehydrogenase family protein [Streptomyces sp. NPDC001027]|uniref:3-hydroxyacyl-CoA dehydrogenase family protein n=1 Tax=Streptomyces sp. NPDC001027 TaxID=3154771 RepID=UPI00331B28C1
MTEFSKIGLLGLGASGAGIAWLFAASGRDVVVLETDQERIDAGLAVVAKSLDGGIARGEVTEDDKSTVLSRITPTTDVAGLVGVDAVIESVTENAEVKKDLLAAVAGVVGERAPILSNTASLSVTDLAASLPNSGRVAGLHFLGPAPGSRTIEVVKAVQTDAGLVDRLVALVDSLADKVAVVVKDRPGFLVNALLLPYLNDVIQEYDDGLATVEDIDVALRLGLGYKTGPFEMLDHVGLDVHLHATRAVHDATGDTRYAPPPLLRAMVAAGQLGEKTDSGFRTTTNTTERG